MNVIFTAHTHNSAYLRLKNKADYHALHVTHKFLMPHHKAAPPGWFSNPGNAEEESHDVLSDISTIRLELSKDIVHEIHVPTCSYRMGTTNMGFGTFNLCQLFFLFITSFKLLQLNN